MHRLERVNEDTLILYLGESINPSLTEEITSISALIKSHPDVIEVTPSYTSILIQFAYLTTDIQLLEDKIISIASSPAQGTRQQQETGQKRTLELPACYHTSLAPDLACLANSCGLPIEEIIRIHSEVEYTVCAIGFAPSFAFLAEVDERIATPRKNEPRSLVPAGSIGIASNQTAVYPDDSPGGWNIIGNCPIDLFKQHPLSIFTTGDKVTFKPISLDEYQHLKKASTEKKQNLPSTSQNQTTSDYHLKVIDPGVNSQVQDLGRHGHADQGITQGGALDIHAYHWANKLLGNASTCSTIEISIGGATFQASHNCIISITGAEMNAKVNGSLIENWSSHYLRQGDEITFSYVKHGMRAYLAIKGGFNHHSVLGSQSTTVRNKINQSLSSGDQLSFQPTEPIDKNTIKKMVPSRFIKTPQETITLHVIECYQHTLLTAAQKDQFYKEKYTVSELSDRMGVRLKTDIPVNLEHSIISEGITLGAIQLPTSGQPIILLNDRQTLGGYPKIGTIAKVDLPLIAQARPGTIIVFKPIELTEAEDLWRSFSTFF